MSSRVRACRLSVLFLLCGALGPLGAAGGNAAELARFDLAPSDPQDTSEPLVVTLDYSARDYTVRDEGFSMLPLPWLARRLLPPATLPQGRALRLPFYRDIPAAVSSRASMTKGSAPASSISTRAWAMPRAARPAASCARMASP